MALTARWCTLQYCKLAATRTVTRLGDKRLLHFCLPPRWGVPLVRGGRDDFGMGSATALGPGRWFSSPAFCRVLEYDTAEGGRNIARERTEDDVSGDLAMPPTWRGVLRLVEREAENEGFKCSSEKEGPALAPMEQVVAAGWEGFGGVWWSLRQRSLSMSLNEVNHQVLNYQTPKTGIAHLHFQHVWSSVTSEPSSLGVSQID